MAALALLAAGGQGARAAQPAVGARYEQALNFVGGLHQVAVTGVIPLPVGWSPFGDARSAWLFEGDAGVFVNGSPDARPFVAVGPVLRVGAPGPGGWFVEFGVSPTLVAGSNFRDHRQLGGSFFFTTGLGAGWRFGRWSIAARFQHISNAHLDSPNPGVNMLGIEFSAAL